MDSDLLLGLLDRVAGSSFASLSAVTRSKGIRHEVTNQRVILFNSKRGTSGYEAMVRRRLSAAGLPPDFTVDDLPFGSRQEHLPGCVIVHKGLLYLQCVVLDAGESHYYIGSHEVSGPPPKRNNQGLPVDRQVVVLTYLFDSISSITLMGETLE